MPDAKMTEGERIAENAQVVIVNTFGVRRSPSFRRSLATEIDAAFAAKDAERDRLRGVVLALLGGDASAPRVLRPNEWARAVEDALRALRGNGREA